MKTYKWKRKPKLALGFEDCRLLNQGAQFM